MELVNLKKMNKKIFFGAVIIITIILATFLFLSKRGTVNEEQWNSIEKGMSLSEVENSVGKPKEIVDDNAEISENVYSNYKVLYEVNSVVENSDIERRMTELDEIYNASESDKNVKQYTYNVKSENSTREAEIYFVGGVVKHVSRSEEE